MWKRTYLHLIAWLLYFVSASSAEEPNLEFASLPAEISAVPQNLLGLAHTPEVQQELRLDSKQLVAFETILREIDAIWWPARILPADQQRKIIADLEMKLVSSLEKLRGKPAANRLRQVELQSQSARVLLRPEVIRHLHLDTQQQKKLTELFGVTDALAKDLKPDDAKATQQFAAATQAEVAKALAILQPAQAQKLSSSLGEPLDTRKVERIYPLAPKLIDSGCWTSASPVSLESLRGQVVLVHFYAFQCHNCVANFKHYKRWDESLKKKGVAVVGVQTPETSAERDPAKVIAAAQREGFNFPVLIDLEEKNWKAWGNTMWPTVYVIDRKGYIRFWWQGELNWQGATTDKKIETVVDQLLKED